VTNLRLQEKKLRRLLKLFAILSVFVVSACANSTYYTAGELKGLGNSSRVLLMPTDVLLSEQTATGILVPNAKWTAAAEGYMNDSIRALLTNRNAALVESHIQAGAPGSNPRIVQILKLHGAVGSSILAHQYISHLKLPSKNEKFDWSLGPEVQALRKRYNTDYALFIYVRDSYASAGRVALVVVGAVFGVSVPTGVQAGFASLVDLRTGNVVWFNRLLRGGGDLRTAEAATDTVSLLLKQFPK
jgi:hypothetical protein